MVTDRNNPQDEVRRLKRRMYELEHRNYGNAAKKNKVGKQQMYRVLLRYKRMKDSTYIRIWARYEDGVLWIPGHK